MRTYRAAQNGDAIVVCQDEHRWQLKPRLDLRNHSPTGMAWGYSGSGASQLALALLAQELGDDQRALRLYQQFKFRAIAVMDIDGSFAINSEDIQAHVAAIEA